MTELLLRRPWLGKEAVKRINAPHVHQFDAWVLCDGFKLYLKTSHHLGTSHLYNMLYEVREGGKLIACEADTSSMNPVTWWTAPLNNMRACSDLARMHIACLRLIRRPVGARTTSTCLHYVEAISVPPLPALFVNMYKYAGRRAKGFAGVLSDAL